MAPKTFLRIGSDRHMELNEIVSDIARAKNNIGSSPEDEPEADIEARRIRQEWLGEKDEDPSAEAAD